MKGLITLGIGQGGDVNLWVQNGLNVGNIWSAVSVAADPFSATTAATTTHTAVTAASDPFSAVSPASDPFSAVTPETTTWT